MFTKNRLFPGRETLYPTCRPPEAVFRFLKEGETVTGLVLASLTIKRPLIMVGAALVSAHRGIAVFLGIVTWQQLPGMCIGEVISSVTIQHKRKNKQKTPCFAPSLKGASAFSGFAPFAPSPKRLWRIGDRVGANKGRKCDFLVMLNSSFSAIYDFLHYDANLRPCWDFSNRSSFRLEDQNPNMV